MGRKVFKSLSDNEIVKELGSYIKQKRLSLNYTQASLAEAVGISRSTLGLLEKGEGSSLLIFVQIMRKLESLHLIEGVQFERELSPIQMMRILEEQKKRKRGKGNVPKEPKNEGGLIIWRE